MRLVAIGRMTRQHRVHRRWTASAVIEHLRNVGNPIGALGQSKHEIVDLPSSGSRDEAADLSNELSSEDPEALEIVRGEQKIWTPVGLEQRILPPPGF